jgi:hypothetical protein
MTPALLFIHGRSQASEDEVARDPKRLEAYILGKKRKWLGGLAKGLIGAGGRPADESSVLFPFYGNEFADAIKATRQAAVAAPNLRSLARTRRRTLVETKAAALLDAASALQFDAARELS